MGKQLEHRRELMPDKNVVISIKDLTLDYAKDKKAFRVFENFSLDIKR